MWKKKTFDQYNEYYQWLSTTWKKIIIIILLFFTLFWCIVVIIVIVYYYYYFEKVYKIIIIIVIITLVVQQLNKVSSDIENNLNKLIQQRNQLRQNKESEEKENIIK